MPRSAKGSATKARQLIDGASFGPDALKAIGAAFDAAWAEICNNFGGDPIDMEKARLRLANALLSIANEESRDVEVLKRAALQRMALDYRRPGEAWAQFTSVERAGGPIMRGSMRPQERAWRVPNDRRNGQECHDAHSWC
jgi:hypothetical protein